MKQFFTFIKFHYLARLEYRGDMLVYSLASGLTPLIALALWVTTSNFASLPYNKYQIMAYFLLTIYVGIATDMWQSWFISDGIRNGNFSIFLLKPLSIFKYYSGENLSDKLFKISVVTVFLLPIFILLPAQVRGEFLITPLTLLLFILSVVGGYLIMFLFELSIGLCGIWFHDIDFLKGYMELFVELLAGKFVPLAFFPSLLAGIAYALPFRYTLAFPSEILLNKLDINKLVEGFSIESFWLLAAFLIYKSIFNYFQKNYQGYGG